MRRYHISFYEDRGGMHTDALSESVGGRVISTAQRYDGLHDLGIIECPDDAAELLEELLDSDADVASYRTYSGAETP